jgi:DMSO/TMAO reductase YedYZ molybdopterin-dependent catalytic subunit
MAQQPPRPRIVSSDVRRPRRIPPGQSQTKQWPVLHDGDVPQVDLRTWNFRIFGLVENEWHCNWDEFRTLPRVDVECDIHCVTRWSRLNNLFSGPSTRTILEKVRPKPAATHALIHCEQDFTTNLSLAEFLADDCLFALEHDGKPITPDHGFPVRLVVPRLYFWKSAKWVRGIELLDHDTPGFWEQNGYHMHGDPWTEERHSGD